VERCCGLALRRLAERPGDGAHRSTKKSGKHPGHPELPANLLASSGFCPEIRAYLNGAAIGRHP